MAEAIRRKRGADHRDTLEALHHLAAAYLADAQLEKALPFLEQSLAGIERLRFQYPSALEIVRDTVVAYEQAGRLDRAEACQRKWVAVVEERSGAASADFATELAILSWILVKQQEWADAEPFVRESLTIRAASQSDAWSTSNTRSLLGAALLGQRRYAEAEPLLLEGYQGMRARQATIPAPAKTRLVEALARLVELYRALGRPDELARWQAELDRRSAAALGESTGVGEVSPSEGAPPSRERSFEE